MAARSAWGIDIGQAGLKAIQLRFDNDTERAVAVAFDYVPHPKILSQPDALPEELIPQAIETFLSRNDLKGQAVAISVPGQTALARFIQLPPVQQSKIAEIIKYEAKQQIPFALEDVIWDYQNLSGGTEANGYMLEAEVGLFAMKRDQVLHHLRPYTNAKVEVDLIQIAPLALYNFLAFDRLGIGRDEEAVGSDEYTIVLDMGADNTTLLVSNGAKIWIRTVNIGGNHFTRALTKEMKLTFAKAEHLKCNATKSPDPRAVFQALRPVFNDYVAEIQRSIGYFSSVNRDAKIARVLGCGNGFKLAGLQKFLQQNLQYEVERVENFQSLTGDAVLNAPLFQENVLSFAVPYGLAVQALGLTRVRTSLLPPEISMTRTIRRKKPYAAAAAALLLLGFTLSAAGYQTVNNSVSTERWGGAESAVKGAQTEASTVTANYNTVKTEFAELVKSSNTFVNGLTTKETWIELHRAINAALPRPVEDEKDIEDIKLKEQMSITSVATTLCEDVVAEWWEPVKLDESNLVDKSLTGPAKGRGYVVTITGHHHHDGGSPDTMTVGYVENTLLKNLKEWEIELDGEKIPVGKMGIEYVVLLECDSQPITYPPEGFGPRPGGRSRDLGIGLFSRGRAESQGGTPEQQKEEIKQREEAPPEVKRQEILETNFTIEFVWRPVPPEKRLEQPPATPAATAAKAPAKADEDE